MPVMAHGSPPYASSNDATYVSQGRYRYNYGVRFVFIQGTSGKFGWVVLPFIISLLAIISVYFGFVGKAMKFLLTKCLGDTSRTYRRAQQDSLNMDREAQQVGFINSS